MSQIDYLTKRVLSSLHWPIQESSSQPATPHVDELERALDIRLPPSSSHQGSTTAGTATNNVIGGASSTTTWSWTPSTNPDNAYTTSIEECTFTPSFYRCLGDTIREAYHPQESNENNASDDISVDIANTSDRDTRTKKQQQYYEALYSLEQYSLPRMHEAVRFTRILLALQEIHVDNDDDNGSSFLDRLLFYCEGNKNSNNNSISCENDCEENGENDTNISPTDGKTTKETRTPTPSSQQHTTKRTIIPILSSLFQHISNLPQLEHGVHQLTRRYTALLPDNPAEYWEYISFIVGKNGHDKYCTQNDEYHMNIKCNNDIGSSSNNTNMGGGDTSWNNNSFLKHRASRIDSFRIRLEEELQCHIHGTTNTIGGTNRYSDERYYGGLVRLVGLMYEASDGRLRGKMRKLMGQRLHSYALGGGSVSYSKGLGMGDAFQSFWGLGPSFAVFCPLVTVSTVSSSSKGSVVASGPISLTSLGEGTGGIQHNPLGMENTSACGIEGLLEVLLLIILGFRRGTSKSVETQSDAIRRSDILQPSHENLLFEVLMPLHRPSGMVLWRDQTPIIGLYHEALVKCIGAILNIDPTLTGSVIGALLHPDIWPTEGGAKASNGAAGALRGAAANTPKVVLLIHEVDTLIGTLQSMKVDELEQCLKSFDSYILSLTIKLCSCISSDNSRTSERALQLFKNRIFVKLVKRNLSEVGPHFLRALCRCSGGGSSWEIPWNPTVRKMTLLVLRELETLYNEQGDDSFDSACDESLSGYMNSQASPAEVEINATPQTTSKRAVMGSRPTDILNSGAGNMTSLRSAMGSWRPPSQKSALPARQPPSTVTGVAPWANQQRQSSKPSLASGQPPLTITGVAPWALNKPPKQAALPRPVKRPLPSKPSGRTLPSIDNGSAASTIAEEKEEDDESAKGALEECSLIASPAFKKVHAYMDKLKSPEDDEKSSDGISSWAKSQMLESPVLLPNLKFHDLVFGQELGTGAFSTVKYARQIVKDRTRSKWPEFAVKIVSTQKIEELGYEQSINREIAILRILSHPGISRLISSFRFRDGAYLVLEYASGGDLHTLLRKNGSLDHDSTKFVIGSVAAALSSIHERGFVYADCKPENILIMESGHVKITDFGGCRPVSKDAKSLVKESSKNLIRHLRDGDWKTGSKNPSEVRKDELKTDEESYEDQRIEGTTAYLPPEVVLGAYPSTAADVWALGCVMFQCLSGRPPILEDSDELTAQKIVSFHLSSQSCDFFGEKEGSSTFNQDEKTLIRWMLDRDNTSRPSIPEVANDAYFEGIDIYRLHTKPAHQLDVGKIAPSSDAKWSRRQFSSIWAPQPQAYNINSQEVNATKNSTSLNTPIIEGDEVDSLFYSLQKTPLLAKIRESS